jgi:hypothetical protein
MSAKLLSDTLFFVVRQCCGTTPHAMVIGELRKPINRKVRVGL